MCSITSNPVEQTSGCDDEDTESEPETQGEGKSWGASVPSRTEYHDLAEWTRAAEARGLTIFPPGWEVPSAGIRGWRLPDDPRLTNVLVSNLPTHYVAIDVLKRYAGFSDPASGFGMLIDEDELPSREQMVAQWRKEDAAWKEADRQAQRKSLREHVDIIRWAGKVVGLVPKSPQDETNAVIMIAWMVFWFIVWGLFVSLAFAILRSLSNPSGNF